MTDVNAWLRDYVEVLEQLAHMEPEAVAKILYARVEEVKQYLTKQEDAPRELPMDSAQASPGPTQQQLTHFDIFLGVHKLAREIARLTETVPVECGKAEDFVRNALRGR